MLCPIGAAERPARRMGTAAFMTNQLFEAALGIKSPWFVQAVAFDASQRRLTVGIDFAPGSRFAHPNTPGEHPVYDTQIKQLRHLNFFQHECHLEVRVPRVRLPDGKVALVEPDWVGKLSGFTLLFEALVLMLAQQMTFAAVARIVGETWHRVHAICSRYVDLALTQADLSAVDTVAIDETSYKRGHNYLTLAADADARKVVFVTEGRDADTIAGFVAHLRAHKADPQNITWIQEAMAALEADAKLAAEEERRIEAEKEKQRDAEGRKKPGKPAAPPSDEPDPKAQRNFTDPESRIMKSKDGFVQAYNAQAAVDADAQIIVAHELTQCGSDQGQLVPLVAAIENNLGRKPEQASADSGYCSEANLEALVARGIDGYVAPGRAKHPTAANGKVGGPLTQLMRKKIDDGGFETPYRLRKQVVEPVFGQIKQARGFRQFLLRGVEKVRAEWAMICTAHNLVKLFTLAKAA